MIYGGEEQISNLIQLGNGFHWFLIVMIVFVLLFLIIATIATQEAGAAFMLVCCTFSALWGFAFMGFPSQGPPLWIKILIGGIVVLGIYIASLEIQDRRERRQRRARRIER